jgi:hypothetical protein
MCDVRIVECPCCEGECVVPTGASYIDYRDGSVQTPTERCDECHGEGCIVDVVQPCTLEDLEEMSEQLWSPQ